MRLIPLQSFVCRNGHDREGQAMMTMITCITLMQMGYFESDQSAEDLDQLHIGRIEGDLTVHLMRRMTTSCPRKMISYG